MDSLPENSKGDLGKNTEQAMPDKETDSIARNYHFLVLCPHGRGNDLAHGRKDLPTPVCINSMYGIYFNAEQSLLFFKEHPFHFYKAFDPTIMEPMPHPLLKSATSFGAIFILGPVYLLTNNLYTAVNVLVLAYLISTACCTYILAKYWLENKRAAFLAGVFMAFGAMNIYWMVDFAFMNFAFFALIILYFERFALEGKPKYLLACTLFLVMQFYFLGVHFVMVGYFLMAFAVLRRKLLWQRRNLAPFVACAIIGAIGIAPLFIPNLESLFTYELRTLSWDTMAGPYGVFSIFFGRVV